MSQTLNPRPSLKEKYEQEVVKKLQSEYSFKNPMAVPRLTKVVINTGIGDASASKERLEAALKDFAAIAGQKPSVRLAKVSVASFNLRKGSPVGLKATLRGNRMYAFLDKLISIVFPRVRDFRGVSLASFDKNGNYTVGFDEHTVFPEVDLSKATKPFGLEVTIVTTAKEQKMSKRLLTYLGVPFEKEDF